MATPTPQSPSTSTSSSPPSSSPPSLQTGLLIAKIEKVFEGIADSILAEKNTISIPLRTRPRSIKAQENASSAIQTDGKSTRTGVRNVTFPNKNAKEAWKFTILLRILELAHEALVTGVVTTKRFLLAMHATQYITQSKGTSIFTTYLDLPDIYYRDPELFTKQEVVDRYVDDIAYTFNVDRHALNIVAAAKGLIIGPFTATTKLHTTIDFSSSPDGMLIPNPLSLAKVDLHTIKSILIIEKEATFHTLCSLSYHLTSTLGPCILVTGKGYPDLLTRRFIHFLSESSPTVPIVALVDFDPDGFAIYRIYTHGSIALAHERDLCVPSTHWLGIRSADLFKLIKENDQNETVGEGEVQGEIQGLLPLSPRDRRVAVRMLHHLSEKDENSDDEPLIQSNHNTNTTINHHHDDNHDAKIRKEKGIKQEHNHKREDVEKQREGERKRNEDHKHDLQIMLFLNTKAEIQILGNGRKLTYWLDEKLLLHTS